MLKIYSRSENNCFSKQAFLSIEKLFPILFLKIKWLWYFIPSDETLKIVTLGNGKIELKIII